MRAALVLLAACLPTAAGRRSHAPTSARTAPLPPAPPQCINLTPEKGLAGLFSSFFFGFWNLL